MVKPRCTFAGYKKFVKEKGSYGKNLEDVEAVPFDRIPFVYSVNAIRCAANFDNACNTFNHEICSNCKQHDPEMPLVKSLCKSCCNDNYAYKWGPLNNVDPGPVPEELRNLTYIECMLIARVHPVVSIYRIKGAQYGYRGHVINFKQNISEYIKKLPIHPRDLPSTIIFNRNTAAGNVKFHVRAKVLRTALIWLIKHNPFYKDIELNTRWLNELENMHDATEFLPTCEINAEKQDDENIDESNDNTSQAARDNIEESFVPLFDNADQARMLAEKLEMDYPTLDKTPINEYKTEGYIVCAFPHLFPYSQADFRAPRDIEITLSEWFHNLMRYHDKRFAQDPRFRFFALNTIMRRQAISQATFFTNKPEIANLTIEELRTKIKEDTGFIKQIMTYAANMRSTKQYWFQRTAELICMIKQITQPTVFFTLSSADYYWPGSYKLLTKQDDVSHLTAEDRHKLMHNNPYLVAWYFRHRVEAFMEEVLIPIFKVRDSWYRYEWQSRGSPHVHGILWFDGAPTFNVDDLDDLQMEILRAYFDEFCFAINPEPQTVDTPPCLKNCSDVPRSEIETHMTSMLNFVQRHSRHGQYCLRKRNKGDIVCRFKFPKPECEDSYFENESGVPIYEPARNDELICKYNPVFTLVWGANIDFNPITNSQAAAHYIAKYAGKPETASQMYQNIFRTLMDNPQNDTIRKNILKFFIKTIGDRDYSAQEVIHLLMEWPLYRCSRQFVIVNLGNHEYVQINVSAYE